MPKPPQKTLRPDEQQQAELAKFKRLFGHKVDTKAYYDGITKSLALTAENKELKRRLDLVTRQHNQLIASLSDSSAALSAVLEITGQGQINFDQ